MFIHLVTNCAIWKNNTTFFCLLYSVYFKRLGQPKPYVRIKISGEVKMHLKAINDWYLKEIINKFSLYQFLSFHWPESIDQFFLLTQVFILSNIWIFLQFEIHDRRVIYWWLRFLNITYICNLGKMNLNTWSWATHMLLLLLQNWVLIFCGWNTAWTVNRQLLFLSHPSSQLLFIWE